MSLAGAAGTVLPPFARAGEPLAWSLAEPRLLEILHDHRIVLEVGRRYRALVPQEDNAAALVQAILAQPDESTATLRLHLEEQVRRDFDSGRTVTLNGWILSVTEARQCALFSLLPA